MLIFVTYLLKDIYLQHNHFRTTIYMPVPKISVISGATNNDGYIYEGS